jgi:hypothetical protein
MSWIIPNKKPISNKALKMSFLEFLMLEATMVKMLFIRAK